MTQSILLARLSAIGDVILSVPVACALRRAFPEARISWIVQQGPAHLLAGHPAIDELLVIPKLSLRTPSSFLSAVRRARSVRPDIAIDVQGLAKSSLLSYLSGAKMRIGFSPGEYEGRECSSWLNNTLVKPQEKHVVMRSLELLTPLGVTKPIVEYNLSEFEEDQRFAESLTREIFGDSPFAVINVGAGWVSKMWPTDRYAAVARYLHQRWNLPTLVLWSGDCERALAEAVVVDASDASFLAPFTTLTQLRSLLKRASLFVGADTGPMHLSVAVDTPTVALIGPMPAERVGPLGAKHRTVQNLRLRKEERSERKRNLQPMLSIDAQMVCDACESILINR